MKHILLLAVGLSVLISGIPVSSASPLRAEILTEGTTVMFAELENWPPSDGIRWVLHVWQPPEEQIRARLTHYPWIGLPTTEEIAGGDSALKLDIANYSVTFDAKFPSFGNVHV